MKNRVTIIVSLMALALAALPWAADLARAVPLAQPRLSDGGTLAQPSRSAGLAQPLLLAAAPSMVSYQGQVNRGGAPFDGNGYFKFAIVDAKVTTSYWSNDGSSSGGKEPVTSVQIMVSNGLFNVLLGDTSLPHMTEPLVAGVFADPECYLRVWFSEYGGTFQQLSPDRRIAAVPYALQGEEAANADRVDGQHAADLELPSGAIVLGFPHDPRLTGAVYIDLGPGTVEHWRRTDPTSAPSARSGHTAVWTGSEMIVWGGYTSGPTYRNDGGRYDPASDTWTAITTTYAPSGRRRHTGVWTGSEMIVWGGDDGGYTSTGGRYDPATNTWTATAITGAPSGRDWHTAVWTGSEMIVWGGCDGGYTSTGGRYDPATNTWTATTTTGAPSARAFHSAVWTGSEMIVWGGGDAGAFLDNGGRYNPATNTWTDMSTDYALSARGSHTAVWTGSDMIVWGGWSGTSYLNSGHSYDPATDRWTHITSRRAPTARDTHTAVWTGSQMIVWGGRDGAGRLNCGGRYDSANRSWTQTSTADAPCTREGHTAVWTDSEMIVWGGYDGDDFVNSGGRYCRLRLYQKP